MNHPAPPTAEYAQPRVSKANSQDALPSCENPVAADETCRATTNVRSVLLFTLAGDEPTQLWLCSTCETDLNLAGHVVARVLSRTYNPDPAAVQAVRDRFAEQATLWPAGF